MKKSSIFLIVMALLLFATPSFSEVQTFIREYTYDASDMDSKLSCQAIALEQVKRLLLEELGTYLENVTVVKNYQLDHDQITTLTAGVVQTTIMEERWDGKSYWLKAKISADPDEVAAAINQLKDNQQIVADLEQARQEADDALAEVETLKAALADASTYQERQSQYDEAVNKLQATDWFERGQVYTTAGQYQEAIKAYDHVIFLRPNDAKSYSNRGTTYMLMGNYLPAAKDFNRAINLNPQNKMVFERRRILNKMVLTPNQLTTRERDFLNRAKIKRPTQIKGDRVLEKQRLRQIQMQQIQEKIRLHRVRIEQVQYRNRVRQLQNEQEKVKKVLKERHYETNLPQPEVKERQNKERPQNQKTAHPERRPQKEKQKRDR